MNNLECLFEIALIKLKEQKDFPHYRVDKIVKRLNRDGTYDLKNIWSLAVYSIRRTL